MKTTINKVILIVFGVAVVGAVIYAFMPKPVSVDIACVEPGPMRVTVDEDGKTRIKERYVVSSPLAGRMLRIQLEPGDEVTAKESLVAVIEPSDPALLDARAHAEAAARVKAAEAAHEAAGPNLARAESLLEQAKRDHQKKREMFNKGAATQKELDDTVTLERVRTQDHKAAEFAKIIARFELQMARAALLRTDPESPGGNNDDRFDIYAPCGGRVLHVFQENAGVVSAGTPLLEFGDPLDLELVIDVLSADAVKIKPGAKVILEQWGGDESLNGTVQLIEPAAFTKVSALGVEEQRVNVIVDFLDAPEKRKALGDGYRVEARIVVWEQPDVLRVPTSALFRHGDDWAVFRVINGRAHLTTITVGRQTPLDAQVMDGLNGDDTVVLHPSDTIKDGVAVRRR